MSTKLDAVGAAKKVVENYFPHCDGALLAGSVVRGEETRTSDLDIVIFCKDLPNAYRESIIAFGWNVELFVHNLESYKQYFHSDRERARPSLPRMVTEGIVLRGEEVIAPIKQVAKELLQAGPPPWDEETVRLKQYLLSDVLDDFIGSESRTQCIFVAGTLADLAHEFYLRTNDQWTGSSKWIAKALYQYNDPFAKRFVEAFDLYYMSNEKQFVIDVVDEILQPHGGRLFEGFSRGKS